MEGAPKAEAGQLRYVVKVEDIARGYGVSRNTISRIVNWKSHKIVQDIPFTARPGLRRVTRCVKPH